jgi:hypothetical protein
MPVTCPFYEHLNAIDIFVTDSVTTSPSIFVFEISLFTPFQSCPLLAVIRNVKHVLFHSVQAFILKNKKVWIKIYLK